MLEIEQQAYLFQRRMAAMTDAELAILGLLSEASAFDYEVLRLIEVRGLRRWTAVGTSSVFYVLEKLRKQGLIARVETNDERRKYEITSAGLGVLQTALTDLLSSTQTVDRSFELGLANLHVLKPSQVERALLSRQEDLQVRLGQLRAMLPAEAPSGHEFQANALFAHRIAMLEAELAWLNVFIPRWQAQAPAEIEPEVVPAIIPRDRQVIMPHDPDSIHKSATQSGAPPQKLTVISRPTPSNAARPSLKNPKNPSDGSAT
jgi:DNA-binding PadR family transcriptional regulator